MSLHCEVIGNGPNLVLVHGWGMHSGVWQPLIKRLSRQFRLHLVDLPGMGHSRPLEPSHLQGFAEQLAEVLPPNTDVCGWSLGGLVAMQLALQQPSLLRRLVLVGSTPRFVNADDGSWQYGVAAETFRQFAAQIGQDYHNTLLKFLTLQCMGSKDARSTVKQLRSSFAARPVPTAASLQKALRILLDNDLREQVPALRRPVLLIHGDRDTLAPLPAAHWMAQQLPFGRLRVIAGASHAPFLSHPDAFIEALVQFLEPEEFQQAG